MNTLGILGMIIILWTFTMVQSHKWSQDSVRYDLLNFLGSALLVAYALDARAWPFVILNGIWALYSLKDILFDLSRGRKPISITQ